MHWDGHGEEGMQTTAISPIPQQTVHHASEHKACTNTHTTVWIYCMIQQMKIKDCALNHGQYIVVCPAEGREQARVVPRAQKDSLSLYPAERS